MLYEIKEGGERTGTFDCGRENRNTLTGCPCLEDICVVLLFSPDCKGFYYVHEALDTKEAELSRRVPSRPWQQSSVRPRGFLCWRRRENSPGTYFRQEGVLLSSCTGFSKNSYRHLLEVLR